MDLSIMLAWVDAHITLIMVLVALWVVPWKGWALWLAARRGERGWFIALLVVNTLALLEIFYIFFVAKRRDMKEPTAQSSTSI